jgi:hypothetical protein
MVLGAGFRLIRASPSVVVSGIALGQLHFFANATEPG